MSISAGRDRRRATGVAAAAVAVALGLTACGSASTNAPPPQAGGSLYQRLVAGYNAYAGCARTHGMPNLPDPQVDEQGNDHYPALDSRGPWRWPESVLVGCAKVWNRVHAIRDQFDSAHPQTPVSPAAYARLLALTRCIRAHGFPTFPDPSPGGGVAVGSVPPGFAKPNLSQQAQAAINACSHGGSK